MRMCYQRRVDLQQGCVKMDMELFGIPVSHLDPNFDCQKFPVVNSA